MKGLISLVFFLLVIACGNKDRIPSGIIPKDSMQHILWEMIEADQYAKEMLKRDSAKSNHRGDNRKLYQEVFDIHHISREQFRESYQFYVGRPDLIKEIFDSLAAGANRRQREIYKPKPVLKHLPN